jgi:hypothetical protein
MMYLHLKRSQPSRPILPPEDRCVSLCPVWPENSNLDEGCSLLVPLRGAGVAVAHCFRD